MDFAQWLTGARKKSGLSRTDVAKAIGVHRVTVAKFEAGKRRPSYSTLLALASVLGARLDPLMKGGKQ